jgi:hypothetical protein
MKIGPYQANVPCLVTWINPDNPVVFGMEWLRTTYPEMEHEHLKLWRGQSKPEVSEPLIAAPAIGNLYQSNNSDRSTVLLAAIDTKIYQKKSRKTNSSKLSNYEVPLHKASTAKNIQ